MRVLCCSDDIGTENPAKPGNYAPPKKVWIVRFGCKHLSVKLNFSCKISQFLSG